MPSSVLIAQREHLGHRLGYCRMLLEALPPGARAVLALTTGAQGSAEYTHHLAAPVAALGDRLQVLELPADAFLADAVTAAGRHGVQRVVVLNADRELRELARLPATAPELRLMIDRTERRRPGDALRLLAKRALIAAVGRRWRDARAHFLTDSFGGMRRRPFLAAVSGIVDPPLLPPSDLDRAAARATLGLPDEAPVLALVGDVSERKNALLVLDAVADPALAHVVLVVAGTPTPVVRARLDALSADVRARVVHHDGYVSDDTLAAAVRAADVLLVLQELDAPSGTVVLAARSGTAVVVGTSPWLRTLVRRFGLGETADHDVPSVVAAVRAAVAAGPHRPLEVPPPADVAPLTALVS